ncbi:MAG: Unknown protein [uncultured Sulfurovum sp.]|uniref:Caspase family p20 domain-containing protein n=1 Tax=uncultured Sulfurovum sp. TaxID=269237 RepID=A0A6S6TU00_9BACT|nr:MAG: Unknown protein [uncultured Sulfurovum sp.]
MKRVAFIYSGDDTGLNSLEHNRNGVAQKLKDFGGWETTINKKLDSELTFIEDLEKYQDDDIDSLLIYYTGHGEIAEPFETFQLKISDKQGITLDTLYSKVYQCFSNGSSALPLKLAIVLDACYSGDTVYKAEQFGTSEIVASSLASQQSFELGFPKDKNAQEVKSKMSLFSHYFCEAIETLQTELELINLLHIRNYINGYVKLQTSPYSFKSIYDDNPMTIAKGSLQEEYLADIEMIYVYVFPNDNQYEVVVNHEPVLSVDKDEFETEDVQKQIIDKINALIVPFVNSRVELMLPKELYSKTLPLWREQITSRCETIIRSEYKASMAENWLPQLKKRWKDIFDICQNKSFLHNDVTTKVQNEAMQHPKRISVLVEKQVQDVKVFDGIDQYYFIALWINSCDNEEHYKNMITNVGTKPLCKLSENIRSQVVDNEKNCSSNINFMWDDPHTYQKEKRYG